MNRNGATPPPDHVTAGFQAADRLGITDGDAAIQTVSWGSDEERRDQILIVSGQAIRLLRPDGAGIMEIHRTDVRSVEAVPGMGLQLRTLGKKWVHRVADADAVFLREFLIEVPLVPPIGHGGLCVPEQHWSHEQVSLLVGRIVIRAAEAEHNLSLVAASAKEEDFDRAIFGQTGKPLAERLGKIGEVSLAVADLAERYKEWSQLRNQLVHSIRPNEESGGPGPETNRVKIQKRGSTSDELYTVKIQDLPDLVDMWYAFNWLWHDASRAYVYLSTGIPASDLPLPNSISACQRLPLPRSTGRSS